MLFPAVPQGFLQSEITHLVVNAIKKMTVKNKIRENVAQKLKRAQLQQ